MTAATMTHDVLAVRVGNGWSGRYQLPARGSIPAKTCSVKDDLGFVRVFTEREAAERAAVRAMLRELNGPAPAVVGKPRSVSRNSRWGRAEAVFAGAR
jgi:hypothetical protein